MTGASGYVGTQLLAALLRVGNAGDQTVRAQVRDLAREDDLRAAVRRGDADDSGLEVVTADLTSDDGWKAAMAGVDEVYHVASPIPPAQPKDPDELVVPAREGTLRVLRAARDAGVRRVVLTSSFAAIGYTPKPSAEFTEDDWTDPDMPGLQPYPRSKTIAERAAWDFMNSEGGEHGAGRGQPDVHPRPAADVRDGLLAVPDQGDVRRGHERRPAAPLRHRRRPRRGRPAHPGDGRAAAAGKRFIGVSDHPAMSYLELAGMLRRRFGPLAAKVPTEEAPGDDLPRR